MKVPEIKAFLNSRLHSNKIQRGILIEGSPGIGKTRIVEQVAKENKIAFRLIHVPFLPSEDYGLPVVNKKGGIDYAISERFPLASNPDCPEKGILLLDELPQADTSQQKVLANLIEEREIHGQKLKDGWLIVATGNRAQDRAGAGKILSHLASRCTRVHLDVTLDDWCSWAVTAGISEVLVGFIRFRPELLNKFDPAQEISPTPRAWVNGVAASLDLGLSDKILAQVMAGDVGEGPAAEFQSFQRVYGKLPDINEILEGKQVPLPKGPAEKYAVTSALSRRVKKETFANALKYTGDISPEFQVLFLFDAMRASPELANSKDFTHWVAKGGGKALIFPS